MRYGIETTNRCNSKCIICPRKYYNYPLEDMSMDTFLNIINDPDVDGVILGGGMGDVSCDNLLIERLRINKGYSEIKTSMNNWRYTDKIIEENLTHKIRFSLFAVTEKTSKKFYLDGSQGKRAVKNIDYFLEKNKTIATGIYTIPGDDLDIIKKLYWDRVDSFEVWIPHNWGNIFNFRTVKKKKKKCDWVRDFNVTIRVNGDVVPCCVDINHDLLYGNINNQTLREIRNSRPYKELKELNERGLIETKKTCKGCSFLDEKSALLEKK